VEEQVHPERLGSERPHATDLLAEDRGRAELCLQDAKAARVAHRRDELRAGQVGTHWRGDDWVLDPQQVAKRGFHEYTKGLTPELNCPPLCEHDWPPI